MTLAEAYPALKAAHVTLVGLSGVLFTARALGVLAGAAWPLRPALRRLAPVIDSALLLAALSLLAVLGLNPFTTGWLQLKLGLLLAYIVAGTLALRRAPTRAGKALALVVALACYAAMLITARGHDPQAVLRLFGAGA